MTKCQIPGQIAKCQIRRSVSAGMHETVPRYISTAPIWGNRNALPSGNAERQGSSGAADEKVLWYAVSRFFFIGHGWWVICLFEFGRFVVMVCDAAAVPVPDGEHLMGRVVICNHAGFRIFFLSNLGIVRIFL